MAFGHGLSRLSGNKLDGETNEIWFRQTFGFRRIAGEWRIAHQHESVPFYMDGSYRAAVDLSRNIRDCSACRSSSTSTRSRPSARRC